MKSETENRSQDQAQTGAANIRKLGEMIKGIEIAMLTTVDPDGYLRSRPMATQNVEFDGDIWFFTSRASGKTISIRSDQHVNVAYANPEKNRYVSVTGRADTVVDKNKMKNLWTPILKAWFPEGLEDPDLALIRVRVESAEYWDAPSSKLVQLYGFAKAMLTGRPAEVGNHEKVDIENSNIH